MLINTKPVFTTAIGELEPLDKVVVNIADPWLWLHSGSFVRELWAKKIPAFQSFYLLTFERWLQMLKEIKNHVN